jgi:hypothetical protein
MGVDVSLGVEFLPKGPIFVPTGEIKNWSLHIDILVPGVVFYFGFTYVVPTCSK